MAKRPLALVTGATGTIGRAVAYRLAQDGYALMLCARQDRAVTALQAELAARYPGRLRFGWWRLDVTDDAAVAKMLARVPAGRGVDLLVTCHGAAPLVKPSLELTAADLERVWRTDVVGTWLAARETARLMRGRGGGAMVFLSSLHAVQTYPGREVYASAKAAILGLVRSLALTWGPWGIRVNAVAPWQTEGPRTQAFIDASAARGEDLREAYRAKSPLRRLIQPEEVADAVVFLARNEGMTGQTVVLDAGVSASMWYQPFTETTEGVIDRP